MKKLCLVMLLLGVGFLGWRSLQQRHASADRGESLVFGRVWVDHLPQSDTDTLQLFAAVKDDAHRLFDQRSGWQGQWELFRYEPRGDGQLELYFPQSKTKQWLSYRAWKCSEQRQFDYCLQMTVGKSARKYYSQRGWEIDSLAGARSVEGRLVDGAGH